MTASRCLCTVGAGLVPALCSRLLFWADTRDAPTDAVLLAVVLRGLKRGLRALRATKGAAGGGVLFALSGGHAGTAPTVSVICTLLKLFHTNTLLEFFLMTILRYLRNRIIDKLKTLCIYPLEPSFKEAVMKSSVT